MALDYADEIGALLFETSALANSGIQDAFSAISRVALRRCTGRLSNAALLVVFSKENFLLI